MAELAEAGPKRVSKRTKFEVFKRDKFRCQYCGKGVPDVVLHVDHITPRSKAGRNDPLNLLTACAGCNLGKADILLSDESAIARRRNEIEIRATKREQVRMMAEWARGLADAKRDEEEAVVEAINRWIPGQSINDIGRGDIRRWVRKYPLPDLLEAIDEAATAHIDKDFDLFWRMVPRYAVRVPQVREKPWLKQVFYAAATMRRRFGDPKRVLGFGVNFVDELTKYVEGGLPVETLVWLSGHVRDWEEFWDGCSQFSDYIRPIRGGE
jgi:hypothetical protein